MMDNQVEQKKAVFFDSGIGGIVYIVLVCFVAYLLNEGIDVFEDMVRDWIYNLAQSNYAAGNAYWADILVDACIYGAFIVDWIILLLVITIPKWNRYMLKEILPGKGNTLTMLLAGLVLGFAMNFSCAAAAMLNNDIKLSFNDFNILPFIFLLVLVFVQSSSEELFCRGYIYQKIWQRYPNKWIPAIVNSAGFAAMHLMNPGLTTYSLLNIFLSGFLYSLMVMYMDSIWCAMAAHTGWNFMQSILLGLPNSGVVVPYSIFHLEAASARNSFAYSTSFGIEGALMAVIVHIVVIAAMIWYFEVKKN